MPPSTIELGALVTGLGGGLALFLFGMRQMTESLKTVAGSSMKNLLARLTANRFTAALAGTIITAVIQSSSVTTVLVVGFISAGLLTLSQSIGVIIGANIGTTITAQIIAFKVYQYGLLMIAIGFLMDVAAKSEKIKQWGMVLMGLGLIFFGMELMSNATGPLRQWQPFLDAMQNMQNPLLSIVIGMIFTAIVQSSSATTGIVIVLASQGMISLESGIGLIFGANIGTCVTAIIAAFGRPREAVQAAWIHVMFNLGGVLLWMFFIPQFAQVVRDISPSAGDLEGTARLAAETPRQIANAHTLFNVGNTSLFIWFTGPLARLVDRIVPKRKDPIGICPKYLDEMYLEHPALALDQVRRELVRLAELDREMLERSLGVATVGTQGDVARLRKAEDDVDALHGAIITYLAQLSQKNLVAPQSTQLHQYISIANYLENVGDVIENNVLIDAVKRMRLAVVVSPSTIDVLSTVHDKVCWAFDRSLEALRDGDQEAAQAAVESKTKVNELAEKATSHLAKRLIAYEPNRLAAFKVETDVIENLKRINTLTRRIARVVLMNASKLEVPVADEAADTKSTTA
ncbi:Na/Pi cotransporter family protein [Aporhodopirellula aestuarii]|uniref:Na/Pi cotransporter family protein n=1 Tax=Aporhodopirellula aestuarii TaxID=2950107 RepID=A0ABT0TZ17_9BACT|nr:Na/Pi cotransporter family protein [Aporhodopirellula aestuarii]MCM2369847.1 Na/Pi cotransporter family protein [Aporhodopirellula aestuarii]